jgi:hypothetical protein
MEMPEEKVYTLCTRTILPFKNRLLYAHTFGFFIILCLLLVTPTISTQMPSAYPRNDPNGMGRLEFERYLLFLHGSFESANRYLRTLLVA